MSSVQETGGSRNKVGLRDILRYPEHAVEQDHAMVSILVGESGFAMSALLTVLLQADDRANIETAASREEVLKKVNGGGAFDLVILNDVMNGRDSSVIGLAYDIRGQRDQNGQRGDAPYIAVITVNPRRYDKDVVRQYGVNEVVDQLHRGFYSIIGSLPQKVRSMKEARLSGQQ